MVVLEPRLAALEVDEGRDPDIVHGVLDAILAELPVSIASKKYHDKLMEQGYCFTEAIKLLTVEMLASEPLGLLPGHAPSACIVFD